MDQSTPPHAAGQQPRPVVHHLRSYEKEVRGPVQAPGRLQFLCEKSTSYFPPTPFFNTIATGACPATHPWLGSARSADPLIYTAPRSSQDAAFNPSTFGKPLDAVFRLQECTYLTQRVPIVLPFLADGVLALGGWAGPRLVHAGGRRRPARTCVVVQALVARTGRPASAIGDVQRLHRAGDAEACCAVVERLPTANRRVVLFVISFLQLFLDGRVLAATKMTSATLLRCGSDSIAVVFNNAQYEQAFVHNLLLHLNCGEIDAQYVPLHGLGHRNHEIAAHTPESGPLFESTALSPLGDGDGDSEITRAPYTSPAEMRFERLPREFFLNVDGLHRQGSYGKLPGLLELTTTHLQWTQGGKKAPAVPVAHPELLQQMRCAQHWRGTASRKQVPKRPLLLPAALFPPPLLIGLQTLSAEFELCERRFPHLNTPDLAALHRELVVSGQVTETEFWEGREHLLLAQAASGSQKEGRQGQLVDPRPQAVEGGENKIVTAPQLVHDVFDEYLVVAKAYDETRRANRMLKTIFLVKAFYSHRASIRFTATQHVVKDDAIFDKYLEKPDDGESWSPGDRGTTR
ncbi:hypothetical protein EDB89DRAFT_2076760 [Lactarius sanguifluus]|nr:hypothetical protein EDB89DRAFT_2076760 [Lactarius sanguifluus]